jgi:hypothetical protein
MGLILTVTAGLMIWIVLWALGIKSFDAFLITIVLAVIAVIGRLFAPLLPGRRDE